MIRDPMLRAAQVLARMPRRRTAIRGGAAAPLLAALALAGCGAKFDPAAGDRASTEATGECQRLADLVSQAQRFNFLTEFANAEAVWNTISTQYEAEDPRARCGDMLPSYAEVTANRALVYSNQRKYTAASGLFRAADRLAATETGGSSSIIRVLETQHDLNRAADESADALAQANDLAQELGESQIDAVAFNADLEQILQLSPQQQQRRVLASLSEFSRSFVFLQQDRFEEGEVAIDRALDLIRPVPGAQTNYAPRYRTTKALLQLGQGKYAEARATAMAAAGSYSEDLAETALRARALAFQARAETLLGMEDAALVTYGQAFDIYQDTAVPIRYDLVFPYFDLALRKMKADPAAAPALTRQIFAAAQTLRSRTTAASLAVAAQSEAEGDTQKAAAIRAYLSAQLDFQRIENERNAVAANAFATDADRAAVEKRYREAADLLEARNAALREVADDYLDLLSARTDLDAIQTALFADEALVQIIPGDPYSIAFVITKDAIRASRVGGSVPVDSVRDLVDFMRAGLRNGAPYRPNDSHALYQEMVEPALALLGDARPRHLIFALSDVLTSLPMEALAVERAAIPDNARRTDFTDVQWMADRYEISYVPSPSTLADLRVSVADQPEQRIRKVVAYGDFRPGVKAEDVLPSYLPGECERFARPIALAPALPKSRDELAILSDLFGDRAEITSGADFTEAAVLEDSAAGRLAQADILHFATHGFLPRSADCLSQGGLTVSVSGAGGEDGVLFESEIRKLDLSGAELVVLTACDTAAAAAVTEGGQGNRAEGGEALSGLTRAFFDAGARAALVTHWPIPDEDSSLVLVRKFYSALDAGATYTEALRAAQKDVRMTAATSDPFWWAPFVLAGDGAGGGRGGAAPLTSADAGAAVSGAATRQAAMQVPLR